MDVPEQAILELREISRDLIFDVPDWVGEDAGIADEVTEPTDFGTSTKAAEIETLASQVSEEPYVDKI
jgi:hypothetical protein